MKLTTTKYVVRPLSWVDRVIAPLVYTWTGLRILMWGEGFIKIPVLDFDSEEEKKEFFDKLEEDEEDGNDVR